MDFHAHFSLIDWAVLLVYLTILATIGVYFSRSQKELHDYFLAGRRVGWIPIGLSLMAALNSGMDYLMQPAAIIKFGVVCLVGNLTWLLIYPYVFFVTLPMYRKLDAISAYEYLERRFSSSVRSLAAVIFVFWRLGWLAAALYTPSLAIAVVTGTEDQLVGIIFTLGIIVTLYTALGGMPAVIWNDVIQFFVMFAGLTVTIGFILNQREITSAEIAKNILKIGIASHSSQNISHFFEYFFIPLPIVGYFLAVLCARISMYTTDQVMVQRFQTAKSVSESRKGFLITALGDILWMLALGFVGVALFTSNQKTGFYPKTMQNNFDQIFPYFMSRVFPSGMIGLVIAAIIAASLSSIDSALNAITTIIMVDFVDKYNLLSTLSVHFPKLRAIWKHSPVVISRCIAFGVGFLGIILASNLSRLGTIFEIANKLVNGFTGPLLGIFILGMFSSRARATTVLIGAALGTCASIYAILWSSPSLILDSLPFLVKIFPEGFARGENVLSFIWPSIFGLLVTLIPGHFLGFLYSGRDLRAISWSWFSIMKKQSK